MMEESTFSHLMILALVMLLPGFIKLMDRINKRIMKDEK